MTLYTVIFEYREGTYIDQVSAGNESEAFKKWALNIDPDNIQHFGIKLKQKLVNDSKNDDYGPTLLSGLTNTWCATWSLSGLINIVKTESKI